MNKLAIIGIISVLALAACGEPPKKIDEVAADDRGSPVSLIASFDTRFGFSCDTFRIGGGRTYATVCEAPVAVETTRKVSCGKSCVATEENPTVVPIVEPVEEPVIDPERIEYERLKLKFEGK